MKKKLLFLISITSFAIFILTVTFFHKAANNHLTSSTPTKQSSSTEDFLSIYDNWSSYFSETFQPSQTFECVNDMINANLTVGDIVSTNGYYSGNTDGAGTYQITSKKTAKPDNGTVFLLKNNLYACLITENDTACVEQFGAIGDGITDNTKALNSAFNSNIKNITLKSNATYKATDIITITAKDLNISGQNSTIFTDNDYKKFTNYQNNSFFIFIKSSKNITFDGINILSNETKRIGHSTQLTIRYSSNIIIKNCTFTIPETVLSDESDPNIKLDSSYCCLSATTGWENITVDNCKISNYSGTGIGGLIGINGMWATDNKGFTLKNIEGHYKGHDEIIALFSLEDSTISDVNIIDNKFYNYYDGDKTKMKPSNLCFSIGYDKSKSISNITIKNNFFDVQSNYAMMSFGKTSSDIVITENTIKYTKMENKKTVTPILFTNNSTSTENNIIISKNTITTHVDNKEGSMGNITYGNFIFENNNLTINAPQTILFEKNTTVTNNTIITNETINGIGQELYTFSNNEITFNKPTKFFFQYYNCTLNNVVAIKKNTFHYKPNESCDETFLMLNGTTLNNKTIYIKENVILMNSDIKKKILCFLSLKDDTLQEIHFLSNSLGVFEKINTYKCVYASQKDAVHIH